MKNEGEITRTISPIHNLLYTLLAVTTISSNMILGADMAFSDTVHPIGAAQQTSGEGFYGPGPALVTAQQAIGMSDDTPVTLSGHIVQSLSDEDYLFYDATGTIRVEIDHKLWTGIGRMGFAVDWFLEGKQGREAIAAARYDAVILDLSLPGEDGLDVLAH